VRHDERTAECTVLTFKDGLLAAVAHDLQLRVSRFTVEVADDGSAVSARFDAASLRVVAALRDGRPSDALSARDRRSIEASIADEVLEVRRYPEIRFRSTSVAQAGERAEIAGELTLHGHTRPLALAAARRDGKWRAEVALQQPDFGITPYTALLGTLRIQPRIVIRVLVPC
jgi:polyisoprenoid-binding protein YceI